MAEALAVSYPGFIAYLPTLITLALACAFLWTADRLLLRQLRGTTESRRFARQIEMLVLTLIALIIVILTLPVGEATRGQLIGLLGLAITAAITLSSATFVSNAMAGLMLRSVGNFRPGDFVRIGEYFGRVTVRGLFHTEIQTADRDLTTLPNLYLVSNPITVVRESGTIVSCNVSIGYDNSHFILEPLMLRATEAAGLAEGFVLVTALNDFSVSYRVAGFLQDVSTLLSAQSGLARAVLDELHGAGIEIMSPMFVGRRAVDEREKVVPRVVERSAAQTASDEGSTPETVAFDKADEAEHIENKRHELEQTRRDIAALENSGDTANKALLDRKRTRVKLLADEIATEQARILKSKT